MKRVFLAVLVFMLTSCSTTGAPVAPANVAGDAVRPLPVTAARIAAGRSVRLVLWGDSISEVGRSPKWHGGASQRQRHWGTLLQQKLKQAYPQAWFEVIFMGIGGQNSYEGLGRVDDLWTQQPDLVLVAFGANDCVWHHLEPAQTQRALTEMVQRIGQQRSEVLVLSTAGSSPTHHQFRHARETVAATARAAEAGSAPFVDLYAALRQATDAGRRWSDYHLGQNNCHPNDRGHEVWAAAVFRVLEASLRKSGASRACAGLE